MPAAETVHKITSARPETTAAIMVVAAAPQWKALDKPFREDLPDRPAELERRHEFPNCKRRT